MKPRKTRAEYLRENQAPPTIKEKIAAFIVLVPTAIFMIWFFSSLNGVNWN